MDDADDPVPAIQGIVQATGTIVSGKDNARVLALQTAMVNAVEECYAEGIFDPVIILQRKMDAHAKTLLELDAPSDADGDDSNTAS